MKIKDMPPEKQGFAKQLLSQARLAKSYKYSVALAHDASYAALVEVHQLSEALYTNSATTYRDGIISLRESLPHLSANWPSWTELNAVPCHVMFTATEAAEHRRVYAKYADWTEREDAVVEILGVSDNGLVPPDRNFDAVRETNKLLLEYLQDRRDDE
jgi:hypothetical protein